MNASTDWVTALAIVATGLVLGLILFIAAKRRRVSVDRKRHDLEARRDALVQQLRDLGDGVPARERASLEGETAEVLRALDALPAASTVTVQVTKPIEHPVAKGFIYGVAATLLGGGIVYYVSTIAHDQPKSVPVAQTPAELRQLESTVKSDPGNVEHRIALAKAYFGRNELMQSFEQTKAVLAQDPNEPRALTYNAIVRMSMGEVDQARAMLQQATQHDPKLLDAWVALASAEIASGNKPGASSAINAAIAQHPEEESRLRTVFAEIEKQAPMAQPAADRLPPDHPPFPGMSRATPMTAATAAPEPAPTAAAGPAPAPIHITLSLDPSSTVKSGIVYVIARGAAAGHPLAVRRLEASAFPLSLDLGGSDSMMGQQLPPKVRIEARLDSDGDAGTKDAADLSASADGVSAGSEVTLNLVK